MGDACYAQGENEKAREYYRRALELDPEDGQAHFNLAEMYYDTGELEAAEREVREALRIDPDLTYAYLTLGNLLIDSERMREAMECFEQFLLRERSPGAEEIREEVALLVEGIKAQL